MQEDERLVVGIDSSTQSVKAIAWTADGTPRAEGRAPHQISTPKPDHAEQNADDWWSAAVVALRQLTSGIDPDQIDGIAISNQRETMVLLDAKRRALAPATLWLDSRARKATRVLAEELGAERLHAISGKPVSIIPCVYRLRYMREHEPELLDRAAQILSVHDFLTQKLTGQASASWTSADPFGIFDIVRKEWSREILDHLGIPLSRLPPAFKPGTLIGQVDAEAAAATGLRAGTPVFAAGGDGHCAGLGVGAISPGVLYLNLGTAVVGGTWSPTPDLSRYWRTLISPSGDGYLLESCQRAGAYFVNWLLDTFAGGRGDPAVFERLEVQARGIPIGSDGIMVSTYLLGCMDPYWDEDARATFTGMGAETTIGHIYRAALEAITLELARAIEQMRSMDVTIDRIVVIGGGAGSQLWLSMIANATGLPVIRGLSSEASALGAGMTAAVGSGWYADFASATAGMTGIAEQIDPSPADRPAWQALSRLHDRIYPNIRKIYNAT
jgi:xylulokinase